MNRYALKHGLVDLVSDTMEQCRLPVEGATYVAGISGGVDSMVLLYILSRLLKFQVVAAHINYGRRGAQSDADEELVTLFCREHNIAFEVHRSKEDRKQEHAETGNFQNQARELRRGFLLSVMRKYEAKAIFLAHHKDDQTETIFQKLLRGAAPEKWTGMKLMDPPWVRPFLEISKEELLQFAEEHAIPYRTDRSNLESNYSRNVLRNEVFPLFENAFPGWKQNIGRLSRSGQLHTAMLDYITGLTTLSLKTEFSKLTESDEPVMPGAEKQFTAALSRSAWFSLPAELRLPVARYWIEKQTGYTGWSRGEVSRLDDLKQLQTGKTILFNECFSVQRDRDRFVLVQTPGPVIHHVLSRSRLSEKKEEYAGFIFKSSRYDSTLKTGVLQLAWEALPEKIILRTWKKGDHIRPLGMKGTQSVADHLTNRKISAVQKNESLVLVSFEGNVHAVIFPHRPDSGEAGTIAEHTRCHTERQRVLLIKKSDHHS